MFALVTASRSGAGGVAVAVAGVGRLVDRQHGGEQVQASALASLDRRPPAPGGTAAGRWPSPRCGAARCRGRAPARPTVAEPCPSTDCASGPYDVARPIRRSAESGAAQHRLLRRGTAVGQRQDNPGTGQRRRCRRRLRSTDPGWRGAAPAAPRVVIAATAERQNRGQQHSHPQTHVPSAHGRAV